MSCGVRKAAFHWPTAALSAALLLGGCVDELEVGRITAAAGPSAPEPDAATTAPAPTSTSTCTPVSCRGKSRACGDCVDNDQDGLVDAEDPECLGACDDTELWLSPSSRNCPNADCFFEPDCGRGNDLDCIALTPNGCDCQGCCLLPDGVTHVLLSSADADGVLTCDSQSLGDQDRCKPCTLDMTCFNDCGPCELCLGRNELPEECLSDASCSVPACDDGRKPCGGCAGDCPQGDVCITGCCVPEP